MGPEMGLVGKEGDSQEREWVTGGDPQPNQDLWTPFQNWDLEMLLGR